MDEALSESVQSTVRHALDRFGDRITRVEVHLSDVNGDKASGEDKRCLLEARPAGHEPIAVTAQATDIEGALHEATLKVQRLLTSLFGRLDDRR